MNTHAQLLLQSVTAPRAAVDLARQHPSTNQLGWHYVAISSVWSFVCDLISRAMFRSAASSATVSEDSLAFLDSPVVLGLLTAFFYVLLYVFLRFFWRKFSDPAVPQSAIDAAIIVSFACSAVLLLPQYLLTEGLASSTTTLQTLGWLIPGIFGFIITVIAFGYAINITFGKSLWLNVLAIVIAFIAFAILMFIAILIWSAVSGVPLDTLMGDGGGA